MNAWKCECQSCRCSHLALLHRIPLFGTVLRNSMVLFDIDGPAAKRKKKNERTNERRTSSDQCFELRSLFPDFDSVSIRRFSFSFSRRALFNADSTRLRNCYSTRLSAAQKREKERREEGSVERKPTDSTFSATQSRERKVKRVKCHHHRCPSQADRRCGLLALIIENGLQAVRVSVLSRSGRRRS